MITLFQQTLPNLRPPNRRRKASSQRSHGVSIAAICFLICITSILQLTSAASPITGFDDSITINALLPSSLITPVPDSNANSNSFRVEWTHAVQGNDVDELEGNVVYSLFGSWESASGGRIQRRLCRTDELSCSVDEKSLLQHTQSLQLQLQVLAEVESTSNSDSLMSLSPTLDVTLPLSSSSATRTTAIAASHKERVAFVNGPANITQALCNFYVCTGGPQWTDSANWCVPGVPFCSWKGITCAKTSSNIVSFNLTNNNLLFNTNFSQSALYSSVNDLFPFMASSLQIIDLSMNFAWSFTRIATWDLSSLVNLQSLNLDQVGAGYNGFMSSSFLQSVSVADSLFPTILLPPTSTLTSLDLGTSLFQVDSLCKTPGIQSLVVQQNPAPFALWDMARCLPTLITLSAGSSGLRAHNLSAPHEADLLDSIFSNLTLSNPQLNFLDISYCDALRFKNLQLLSEGASAEAVAEYEFGFRHRNNIYRRRSVMQQQPKLRKKPKFPYLANIASTFQSNATRIFSSLRTSSDPTLTPNWPRLRSSSLQTLFMDGLYRLNTDSNGPPQDWLSYLPSLQQLSVANYSVLQSSPIVINTAAFEQASLSLQSIRLSQTFIIGTFEPLFRFKNLQVLEMDEANYWATLPTNVSSLWPNLQVLSVCCNFLNGTIPSFANLPQLNYVDLSDNSLIGPLSHDFLYDGYQMNFLDLGNNFIHGRFPTFSSCCSQLQELLLNGNMFSGKLDFPAPGLPLLQRLSVSDNNLTRMASDIWVNLPALNDCDLSLNYMIDLPDPPTARWFSLFTVSANNITGTLPKNIYAMTLDYSYNQFSGPVSMTQLPNQPQMYLLNLAFAGDLDCPLYVDKATGLSHIDLQSAGFDGCAFNDPAQVSLPIAGLTYLDISNNAWAGGELNDLVLPQLRVFKASNASLQSISIAAAPLMHTLVVDGNQFRHHYGEGEDEDSELLDVFSTAKALQFFSCVGCQLAIDLMVFLNAMKALTGPVFEINLGNNDLHGELDPTFFSHSTVSSVSFMIRQISLKNNPRIIGLLPSAVSGYADLQVLDISSTAIEGSLPDSWATFIALQRLNLENTQLRCAIVYDANNVPSCHLPTWLTVSPSATIGEDDAAGTSNFHCPQLSITAQNYSIVTLSQDYTYHTLCQCNDRFFGKNANCFICPSTCICKGDIISNCFPIVEYDPDTLKLSLQAILPCLPTMTGKSLCNPHGMPWPQFMLGVGQNFDLLTNLKGWCVEGFRDRLCSRCEDGFFASGKWCLQCLSTSMHVMIIIVNVGLFGLLVAYLYARTPSYEQSVQGLRGFQRAVLHHKYGPGAISAATAGMASSDASLLRSPSPVVVSSSFAGTRESRFHSSSSSPHLSSLDAEPQTPLAQHHPDFAQRRSGLLLTHPTNLLHLNQGHEVAPSSSPNSPSPLSDLSIDASMLSMSPTMATDTFASPSVGTTFSPSPNGAEEIPGETNSSPVKLLVFHAQQLSILLLTSTAMPQSIASLMSIMSAGSGFNFSSLLAIECLSSQWNLQRQCWMALLAPLSVLAFAATIYFIDKYRKSKETEFSSSAASSSSSSSAAVAERINADLWAQRWYGVCVSLLYVFVVPCAQAALSALSCTDTRQATTDTAYLNLFPYQACDDEWKRTILPPALMGVLVWFFVFPIFSTFLFRHLRKRLRHHDDVSLWPLCSDLLKPFHTRYWYFEQVLLVRRLLLVSVVALIPSLSMYLPIALFGLIQVSALFQHVATPYKSEWMNRGELTSLYLLLINYFTALVLHASDTETTVSSGGATLNTTEQLDTWSVCLFIVNLLFLLLLLLALFRSAQTFLARIGRAIVNRIRHARDSFAFRRKAERARSHHAQRQQQVKHERRRQHNASSAAGTAAPVPSSLPASTGFTSSSRVPSGMSFPVLSAVASSQQLDSDVETTPTPPRSAARDVALQRMTSPSLESNLRQPLLAEDEPSA